MSWSLQLDVHQSEYRPGDIVTETVRLVSENTIGQDVYVASIMVEIAGISITAKNRPHVPYTIVLFSFNKTLVNGPRRLRVPGHRKHRRK